MSRFYLPPALLFAGSLGLALAQEKPLLLVRVGVQPAPPPTAALTDEEALKQGKLDPTDGGQLVGYLKQRTLSDADHGKIQSIIKQFAADDFDTRLKAGDEIAAFGPAAIGPLKTAERDSNAEVAYRAALALKKVSAVNHSAVAAAAARGVVKLKPPGAAGALLGFLPLADSEAVADDIRAALVALAVANGKAEPALVAALADPSPVRRTAAYIALVEGGPPAERVRIKDAFPLVRDGVRKEADLSAKFAGLWSLLVTTREKEFVPDLIGLMAQMPRGRVWQIEDYLLQVSGAFPPGTPLGKTPESVAKAQAAWAAWWAAKGGAVDLAKLEFKPRVKGLVELVEADMGGLGRGHVSLLGPDLKEKWRLTGTNFTPTDARVLSNDRVLVVESLYNRVSERETGGKTNFQRIMAQPLVAEPLPDDRFIVVGRAVVSEYDKNGGVSWNFTRNNGDILSGRVMPNGDVLFVTMAVGVNVFRIDKAGKDTGKTYTVGRVQMPHSMDVIDDDRVLICEIAQVAEYDLKTQKILWKHPTPNALGAQRLPNGNTLITTNTNRAVEVTPDGTEVWEYSAKDNLRVSRVYRR